MPCLRVEDGQRQVRWIYEAGIVIRPTCFCGTYAESKPTLPFVKAYQGKVVAGGYPALTQLARQLLGKLKSYVPYGRLIARPSEVISCTL